MANKFEEPPPYAGGPQAPKPVYGQGPGPYPQEDPYQERAYYPQDQQMGYYNQQQPPQQMGYYPQQPQGPGPFPAGYGPYPPQAGPYGQRPVGYMPQDRRGPGLLEGLLAGLACCCCLDILF